MNEENVGRLRFPFESPPEAGSALEVADGLFWVRIPLPGPLNHVNVYVLDDGTGWTIVDTGIDSKRTRALWQTLLEGPFAGKPVRRVVATHHHSDHIGLAGWFMNEHGAELWTTRTSWLMARMLQLDVQERPSRETLDFWRGAGMAPGILAERAASRPYNSADISTPLPLGFRRIEEGEQIAAMGGRDWTVRVGHGHASEHATLWSTDGEVVLGGDQFLPSISPNLGVYATEPEADVVGEWIASCAAFRKRANETSLVLPGHKLPYTGLGTRLRQLEDNHHAALERLRQHLVEPRTAVECFPILFMRKIGDGEYGLALVEAMAHCIHLWKEGHVRRKRGPDGAWLWQSIDP